MTPHHVAPRGDAAFVLPLTAVGYVLRVIEREHRMFRDWLRVNAVDRALYESVKRELASREWRSMNDYAEAKADVVAAIMGRAEGWASQTRWSG